MKRPVLPLAILAAILGAAALGCESKKETAGEATPERAPGTTSATSEWTYSQPPTPALEGTPAYRLGAVAFAEGSGELTAEAMSACAEMAMKLKELPHARVGVIGFADGVKEKGGAQELGLRRAESVRAHLATLGIPAEWVDVASFGDRTSTGDAGKMEMERKAELWVLQ